MSVELKDQIRIAREAQKLSKTELAAEIGLTAQSITHWENGRGGPSRKILPELERVLKIKLDLSGSEQGGSVSDGLSGEVIDLAKSIMTMPKDMRDAFVTLSNGIKSQIFVNDGKAEIDVNPFYDREGHTVQPHFLTTIQGQDSEHGHAPEIPGKKKSTRR